MTVFERSRAILFGALVAQIPFETRYTVLGLSNLQWTFLAVTIVSIPLLWRNWQNLRRDRLSLAAAVFVAVQWAAAFYAPEFNGNAYKAAIRFTAGLMLLLIARCLPEEKSVLRIWVITSFIAAVYGLFAQAGFGLPLFRAKEFFIAQVQRLSGSFEYPNVAAAYFAMSLPVVWESPLRPRFKWSVVLTVWSALLLTFSRGAVAAVLVVAIAEAVVLWTKRRAYGTALTAILAAVVATATMATFTPNLFNTFKRLTTANAPAAQYKAAWNRLRQQPGVRDEIQLNIQNAGTIPWPAKGRGRVAISYRWRNLDSSMTIAGSLLTPLDRDVRPGESVDVLVSFETPQTPARYILAVEPFVRDLDWFSNAGSPPFYIETEIAPGVGRSVEQADLSAWYRLRAQRTVSTDVVSRSALWKAALRMFTAHPGGVGPDNYRLQAGRLLHVPNWNTDVHSNNLYLELLTGSGLLGLAGFAFVLISIRWQVKAACLAISVFLIHGFVDAFLMSTPIYFSFWILVGLHRKNEIRSTASPIR